MSKVITFILISPKGAYAFPCFTGGDFVRGRKHNDIMLASRLNEAHVFAPSERQQDPYKRAIEKGFIEVPAYSVRTVTVGVYR